MITREMIITKLQEKYPQYSIIPQDVVKNGDVHLEGICIRDTSPIAPTIYTEGIIEKCQDNLEEAVAIISNIIEQHQAPDIDVSMLSDRGFILDRIRIGVQKQSEEKLVKRPVPDFPDMEQYLYFCESGPSSHDMWSVKLRPELMETAGIDEEDAWKLATEHTFSNITITSMAEVLASMMGIDYDEEFPDTPCEMYVITNHEKCKGAAGILNHDLLERFAKQHNCKSLCVLPSSLHECILVPLHDESYSIEDFNALVREVNSTQVDLCDKLTDRAYIISFA